MKKSIVALILLIIGFNANGQSSSPKNIEQSINEVFESYAHYNRFIGSVLISQDDTIIYKKSFGYADIDTHKKNTENSIFSIASVTKSLTAVGIMKLVEDGKLTLETPISTFFPSFIPDYSKDITIRHLLNHSSGMQANIGRIDDQGNGLMPGENPITINELIEKFKDSKLNFEPGDGYEYNNFGYTLLANIIESITKLSYVEYMEQAVFNPAKMKNTAVNSYKNIHKRAYPHIGLGMNAFEKFSYPFRSSWVNGAGNINSTTGDLHNFMKVLEKGTLLKPTTVEKLYSYTQATGVNASEYGLGWKIENKGGEKWVNHTGLLPGITTIIGSLPQRKIKIIILSNATSNDLITESSFQGKSQFVSGEIIDTIIALLQGKEIELLPVPIKIITKNSADYNRTYKIGNTHSFVINKQGDNYSLETIGSEFWSIFTYPFSRDTMEDNKLSATALFFANAMSAQNFKGLSDYSNEDMKGFLGTEEGANQLKGMWDYWEKEAGEFISYNIYKIEGEVGSKTVHIRFHFEKNDIGLILGINSKNQIQGMFKDNDVKTSPIKKVKLIPITKNEFFIDGHQNGGMQDLRIKLSANELIIIDDNTTINARLVSSNKSIK